MKTQCAWCRKDMGDKPSEPELDDRVSHGICPECREKEFPDVAKEVKYVQMARG